MIKDLINTGTNGDGALRPLRDQPSAATVSRETPVYWLPLDRIQDNPYQPRQHYDAEHILNLALSIKQLKRELPATRGLQQLPLARLGTLAADGEFDAIPRLLYSEPLELRRLVSQHETLAQLMFGHSRLRAFRVLYNGLIQFNPMTLANSLMGGPQVSPGELGIDIDLAAVADWQTRYAELMEPDQDYAAIPLTLGFALDLDMWRHAITENSQRKNINPIEEAAAMARAQQEFGLTDEEAGKPFGYARSTAANKMRLLNLPAEVQRDIAAGKLTERHGRELLRLADDPDQLKEAHKTAIRDQKTVASLTQDVNWRAKRIENKREKERQLDVARAILEAGWTPPGSEEPLPADRVQPDARIFDIAQRDHRLMLEHGLCGSHCSCCVLAFDDYKWYTLVAPDPERVPQIGLACASTESFFQKRAALEQIKRSITIEPTEAERQVAEQQAQREATVAELNRLGRERWERALAKLDKAALWQDMRFWRAVHAARMYDQEAMAKDAQTVMEFQEMLLEGLYRETKSYDRDLGDYVPNLVEIDRMITALTQPLEKPAQPRPGDSQKTGWEDGWDDHDQGEYDELTRDGRASEEILAYINDWMGGGEFNAPRVILRLIEECDDKAVRGQLWRRYNELEGVSRETVGEDQP